MVRLMLQQTILILFIIMKKNLFLFFHGTDTSVFLHAENWLKWCSDATCNVPISVDLFHFNTIR